MSCHYFILLSVDVTESLSALLDGRYSKLFYYALIVFWSDYVTDSHLYQNRRFAHATRYSYNNSLRHVVCSLSGCRFLPSQSANIYVNLQISYIT